MRHPIFRRNPYWSPLISVNYYIPYPKSTQQFGTWDLGNDNFIVINVLEKDSIIECFNYHISPGK